MAPDDRQRERQFRIIRAVGRHVLNPTMRRLVRWGVIRGTQVCELETTGRKTGQVRRVPVSPMFDDTGAWVICGHGTRSGWGANIAANPDVRLQRGDEWIRGTARFVPEDDVAARIRAGSGFGPKVAAKGTDPVTVRIDFVDQRLSPAAPGGQSSRQDS